MDPEVATTNTRYGKQNLGQLLDELLDELPKKAAKKSRGTKSRPLNDQFCSTTSLVIEEHRNGNAEESKLKPNNYRGTTSGVATERILFVDKGTECCINVKPKFCHSTSITIDEYNNYLIRHDEFPKSNYNDHVGPNDAEMITCKGMIECLSRSNLDLDHDECATSTSLEYDYKNPMREESNFTKNTNYFTDLIEDRSNERKAQFAEKTTYCRPVVNIYSQHFIYKAIERHSKLQYLVKRLVQAREKEKQDEAWNNYINELKNKHGYSDCQPPPISKTFETEDTVPCIIDDCYKSKNSWKQSDYGDFLFKNFCRNANKIVLKENNEAPTEYEPTTNSYKYANTSFCFPTSSQGRYIMMNRERNRNESPCPIVTSHDSPVLVTERPSAGELLRTDTSKHTFERDYRRCPLKCSGVQTKIRHSNKSCQISHNEIKTKTKNMDSGFNMKIIEQKAKCLFKNSKQKSLFEIENKLDALLKCVNAFLEELKSNKSENIKSGNDSFCCEVVSDKSTDKIKSDVCSDATNQESLLLEISQERPESTLSYPICTKNRQDTLAEILNEELDKSNQIKRDLEKILSNGDNRGALKITLDVPTKDHSTELTKSFYEKGDEGMDIKDVDSDDQSSRMAIAVNTDPLGLLALFRVSAETVKQVLSFVPSINYVLNLPRLQMGGSQAVAARVSRFFCNVCGASFALPSLLSDHIQEHNLGDSRNCCVCRHVLDTRCQGARLFACQHCGQLFTRAYCRQLHEQTCCKRNWRTNSKPSLMLLS